MATDMKIGDRLYSLDREEVRRHIKEFTEYRDYLTSLLDGLWVEETKTAIDQEIETYGFGPLSQWLERASSSLMWVMCNPTEATVNDCIFGDVCFYHDKDWMHAKGEVRRLNGTRYVRMCDICLYHRRHFSKRFAALLGPMHQQQMQEELAKSNKRRKKN